MNNIEEFVYSTLIEKNSLITKWEMMKAIYKTASNKILKINEVINKALRQLIHIVLTQITSLFEKCIQKNIQSTHFKKIIIIILRKSNKKNYTNLSTYKFITLLNILSKTLKFIISKRLYYVIEKHDTLLNTQMKIKKQQSMNTIL